MNAYDFIFRKIDGGALPLAAWRGKPVLVVNTASECGYTPQYAGLEKLWQRYRDRGFILLGVPSNDFGAQEPGSESEIKSFCETNFGVDFPLAAKEPVTGGKRIPSINGPRRKPAHRAGTSINILSHPTARSPALGPRGSIPRTTRSRAQSKLR